MVAVRGQTKLLDMSQHVSSRTSLRSNVWLAYLTKNISPQTCTRRLHRMHRVYRFISGLLLLVLLAGHVATLAIAAHHQPHDHLLLGGAVLCSVLVLPLLTRLLPRSGVFLRRAWLAVHLTYTDDMARRALGVLCDMQARPLVHGLGLAPPDPPGSLEFRWWALQGLLLTLLAGCLSGPADPDHSSPDDDPEANPDLDLVPVGEREELEEVPREEVDLRVVVVVVMVGRVDTGRGDGGRVLGE